MWITLLFIAQVACEWVQISQQHYRKPYRPAHNHPALTEGIDFEYEDDSTPKIKQMYNNQSMHGYRWKDSDLEYNNKGFVTKVKADGDHFIRGDVKHTFNNEDNEDVSDVYDFKFNNRGPYTTDEKPIKRPMKISGDDYTKQDAIPHNIPNRYGPDVHESQNVPYYMIPNVGSIKRVHLDSRTVRTPILKDISDKLSKPDPAHDMKPPVIENNNSKDSFPSRPVIIWQNENQTKKVIPGIIQKVSKDDLERRPLGNNSKYEEITLNNKDHSINKNIFMTHAVQSHEGISGEAIKLNQLPDINFEKPVFVTKEEFEDDGLVTISSDATTERKTTESIQKPSTETPKHNIKQEKETPNKVNIMENVLKFMRIVTDVISRNTRRSVGSKVRYLENLQDIIMANIEHRIDTIWPDDAKPADAPTSRKARSATSPRGGGHVEFPSSESALMTISFLTFAVYLIKLVLQVIHTYKNKAMMLTPAVVTAVGRTVTAVYRRPDIT